MICPAIFNPCMCGLVFFTIRTTVRAGLRMTIWAEQTEIFESIVVVDAVYVLELKNDFLFTPHQYTITLCEIFVLTFSTLVNFVKLFSVLH